MGRHLVACSIAVGLAACSDPKVAITIRYPPANPAQGDLRDQLASLTVAVIQLPPVDGHPVDCEAVRYGAVSAQALDGGRRASASVLVDDASLDGIPRLGDKLFVLDGKDANGDRIAGGCDAKGDVTDDTTIELTAEIAPRVRLLGLDGIRDPTVAPADFSVALIQPWKQGGKFFGLGGVQLRVDARDLDRDQLDYARATSCAVDADCPGVALGVATLPISSTQATTGKALAPGPIELVVHAPWATEPLVVRAFQPLPALPSSPVVLAPAGVTRPNQTDPSWVVTTVGDRLRASAIHATAGANPVYRIVTAANRGGSLDLDKAVVPVGEPAHALVAVGSEVWTVTATGWRQLVFPAGANPMPTLTPGDGRTTEAATELHAIGRCGEVDGVLARFADDGPYVAFGGPRADDPVMPALQRVVAQVNGSALVPPRPQAQVVGNVCLTWRDGNVHQTLVLRRNSVLTLLNVDTANEMPSPISSGFVGYQLDDNRDGNLANDVTRLAGGSLDVTGPHLQSFTLTTIGTLVDDDGRLDGELTNLPTDTSVLELADAKLVASSHVVLDATRLQLTVLPADGRAPVTGLSAMIPGIAPKIVLVEIAANLHVAAVATSEQLALFRLEAP